MPTPADVSSLIAALLTALPAHGLEFYASESGTFTASIWPRADGVAPRINQTACAATPGEALQELAARVDIMAAANLANYQKLRDAIAR